MVRNLGDYKLRTCTVGLAENRKWVRNSEYRYEWDTFLNNKNNTLKTYNYKNNILCSYFIYFHY